MPSGSVISLGIEVNGEQTFNNALKAIDAQIKSFGSGVQAVGKQMDAMGESEELNAKKTDLLAKTIDANREKMALLEQKYASATSKLGELGRALQQAQQSGDPRAIDTATNAYNKQVAVVADLEGRMHKTESAIAQATSAMNAGETAADQETAAMQSMSTQSDQTASAVQRMANIMTAEFAAKAAKAVVDAFATIVSKAVEAGQYIFNLTTEAGKYADSILTLAETSNVDVVNLQKWEYASQFIDTEVSTITGSLTKLTKNMTSESAATTAAFEQLGVKTRDSSGNFKDAETVMWEVIDALGNVTNQTERDALAMTLMGKSAQDLNPLINAGSEAFKALGTEAQNAGLIMSTEAMTALGGVDDAMNRVNSTITGVKNAVAVAFAPAITQLTDGFTSVVQAGMQMVQGTEGSKEKFLSAIDNLTDTAVKLLNEMLPVVLETGVNVIVNLVNGILRNIDKITASITQVVTTLIQTISKNLPQILKAGIEILMAIIDGIIKALPDLAKNVPEIIGTIVSGLASLGGKLIEAGKNIIVGLWDGIKKSIGWLWEKIKEALGSVFGWVLDLLGIHSPSTVFRDQVGKNIVLGIAQGITDSAGAIQDALDAAMPTPGQISAAVDGVTVAARVAARDDQPVPWQDNRPIIIKLNDREVGRAVRGYA